MLPLQVQIRADVVHKQLKESKHVNCRCRRRALHDPELLVVSFWRYCEPRMSYAVWGLHPGDVGPDLAGSRCHKGAESWAPVSQGSRKN
jgi:hypothetical protein